MSHETLTKPELDDSAQRNTRVVPAQVERYTKIVEKLVDYGVQPSKYGVSHPLTGSDGRDQRTRSATMHNV